MQDRYVDEIVVGSGYIEDIPYLHSQDPELTWVRRGDCRLRWILEL